MEGFVDVPVNVKLRREPPQPLGSEARYFSVSAATPLALSADPHPSGVSVRVKLDSSSHPGQPFRTSELIQGRVHIYAPSPEIISAAARLSLRIFFESRTLFWNLELVSATSKAGQQMQKMKAAAAQDFENVMRHEVHRGVVPPNAVDLSWSPSSPLTLDFQSFSSNLYEATVPFSFIITKTMSIAEYNKMENAPRELCSVERCPPPTLRDCRDGSIQWITEAVLALQSASSPVQDDAMLRQSTENEIVTRLVFPVVPALEDLRSLRNEPYFGQNSEIDEFGSRRLSAAEQESAKKATLSRISARGGSWEAHVKNIRHSSGNFIASQVYTTKEGLVPVSAPSMPLIAYLKFEKSSSKSLASFFRPSKPRPVYLQYASVTLLRISSTRGGKEVKPHVTKLPLRRQEHRFDQGSSTSTPGLLLPFEENADALELDLTLDLQSDKEMNTPGSKQVATAAKSFTPSFRTPNIQHEYLVTISFIFSGDESIERFATRFPVQFVPGNENELPTFEDIANETNDQPPPFQAART
ncbi:hypothetical protein RhiJN_22896 [Ceratobasidium sp. AG-Ba]|nr:hypothetical protein RhiJN_22896 [Ceratobasidium sp. AG-Ba]